MLCIVIAVPPCLIFQLPLGYFVCPTRPTRSTPFSARSPILAEHSAFKKSLLLRLGWHALNPIPCGGPILLLFSSSHPTESSDSIFCAMTNSQHRHGAVTVPARPLACEEHVSSASSDWIPRLTSRTLDHAVEEPLQKESSRMTNKKHHDETERIWHGNAAERRRSKSQVPFWSFCGHTRPASRAVPWRPVGQQGWFVLQPGSVVSHTRSLQDSEWIKSKILRKCLDMFKLWNSMHIRNKQHAYTI